MLHDKQIDRLVLKVQRLENTFAEFLVKKIWEDKALFDEFCLVLEKYGIQRYWNDPVVAKECYARCQTRKIYC
jgi:hypothetical protein